MQENLRYYLQKITLAQEEERKRIARELRISAEADARSVERIVGGVGEARHRHRHIPLEVGESLRRGTREPPHHVGRHGDLVDVDLRLADDISRGSCQRGVSRRRHGRLIAGPREQRDRQRLLHAA